jgi:hypothetical protein
MARPWANSEATVNEIFLPLDTSKSQIRVATLHPRESADALIRVTLQAISLREEAPFDALSWAWGDANDVRSILLNDKIWWSPKNLAVALENLQLETTHRILWIDALCINQSRTTAGLAERAHQIGLMRHVYTKADHVLVWMGIEREYTEGVLTLLSDVADAAKSSGDEPAVLPRSFHVAYKDSWKVLHLLSEPWWDRLWVLQEVGLGRDPILHHGAASTSFHKALFAINMLEARGHLWNTAGQFEAKVGPFNNPEFYGFSFKDRYNNPSVMAFTSRKQHFITFTNLLVACRFRSATDPRDKIFGLFGLVPDLVLRALQPQYDESVEKAYIRIAFTLMGESRSLSLLSHTTPWLRNRAGVPNLPSWVPDWTIRNDSEYWTHLPDHMSDKPAYVPCQLGNQVQLSIQDGRYLRMHGVLIDKIAKKGHGYHGLGRSLDWSKHRRTLSRVCFNDPVDVLENDLDFLKEHRWHAIWQCFSFAYIDAMLDVLSLTLFAFMRWVDLICHNIHYKMFPHHNTIYSTRKACEKRDFEVMRTSKHLKSYLKDRPTEPATSSIFTTEDGFIGVGPAFIEPGDHVFVVAGAAYPLLLRMSSTSPPRNDYVGECYLAGIMQGEVGGQSFASWRARKREMVPGRKRQLHDEKGIWEEVVLE